MCGRLAVCQRGMVPYPLPSARTRQYRVHEWRTRSVSVLPSGRDVGCTVRTPVGRVRSRDDGLVHRSADCPFDCVYLRNGTVTTAQHCPPPPPPLSKLRKSTELIRSLRLLWLRQGRSLRATHTTTGTHATTNKGEENAHQSAVGSSGQTITTNVPMTQCNWQICHQNHVLCGCTTFRTERN